MAVALAGLVAVGAGEARADGAPARPADPQLTSALRANLARLDEALGRELDLRVRRQADAWVAQAAEAQLASLFQHDHGTTFDDRDGLEVADGVLGTPLESLGTPREALHPAGPADAIDPPRIYLD